MVHPLQIEASENTEGGPGAFSGESPFLFFIFLPRCPNIIPSSLERKDPSPCPRRRAAAHLLGRKERQSLSQEILEIHLEDPVLPGRPIY